MEHTTITKPEGNRMWNQLADLYYEYPTPEPKWVTDLLEDVMDNLGYTVFLYQDTGE